MWYTSTRTKIIVRNALPPDDINDFGILQKLINDSNGVDPFVEGDYLNKKILKLVSLTHFSKKPVSLNQNETRSIVSDFSYLLNELRIAVNVKNFYSRLLGCKRISNIQVRCVTFV